MAPPPAMSSRTGWCTPPTAGTCWPGTPTAATGGPSSWTGSRDRWARPAPPSRHQARILIHAPLEAVGGRSSPAAGRLEATGQHACVLHTGSNSLEELALYTAIKGFDFQVLDPPELIPVLHALARRLRQAADVS